MALQPANQQRVVHDWISELYSDVDQRTGYLVKEPTGTYGKKIKELVRYASSLSVEMKAIHHSRRIRTHPFLQYLFSVFQFLSDMVFPVVFATVASYLYYEWKPAEVRLPPRNETSVEWTPQSAGEWLGSSLRSVIAIPVRFIAGTVDRGLHVEEAVDYMRTTGSKIFLLPLLFLAVYIGTKILGRLVIHIQTICSAHSRVWALQELLLKETEEALERAIVGIMQPTLVSEYEKLIGREDATARTITTRSEAHALSFYQENPSMLHQRVLERASTHVKELPFAELLRRGHLSALYAKTIHALIRHADEELSTTMFTFHEEIHRIPAAGLQACSQARQAITG